MKWCPQASLGSQLKLRWHTCYSLSRPSNKRTLSIGGLFKMQNFPSLPLACQCHCCLHLQPHHHPSIHLQALSRGNIFNHHSPISHVNISARSDEVRAQMPKSNYVLLSNKHFKRELSDWNVFKCASVAAEFRFSIQILYFKSSITTL